MPEYIRSGRIAGILFLTALGANLLGSELLDAIVTGPDYLTETAVRKTSVVLGVLAEMVSAFAVVGIGVVLYPVLRAHNPQIARAYLALRLIEPMITILIVLSSLLILTLSLDLAAAGGGDPAPWYPVLGGLLQGARDWALMIYILVFCAGAALFYSLLYRTRLVPRILSVWGLLGTAILFGGALIDMLVTDIPPEAYGAVMGLNEIVFPIWLIMRGFDADAVRAAPGAAPA